MIECISTYLVECDYVHISRYTCICWGWLGVCIFFFTRLENERVLAHTRCPALCTSGRHPHAGPRGIIMHTHTSRLLLGYDKKLR